MGYNLHMEAEDKKPMTLEDLATMVAGGFNDVITRIEGLDDKVEGLESRMGTLENRMDTLGNKVGMLDNRLGVVEHKLDALNSNVNNYLELSEKRYMELKQRDAMLAQWIKLVAKKVDVPIDVTQFEKI